MDADAPSTTLGIRPLGHPKVPEPVATVSGNNGGMITVTEPQIWTMIGLMAAVFFGTMTLVSTMLTRVMRSEFGGLRGEMNAQIGGLRGEMNAQIGGLRGEMNARFETVSSRFDLIDVRFDAVNSRIDGLDQDVQLLMNREITREN